MKKCKNCSAIIRDNDRYCRNCGILIPSNFYELVCNIFIIFMILGIIFFAILFITSYVVE
ncbi:MAG: hypothetical protein IKF19_06910 [Bacilli bacterium]|nr:hypothetical protein [Bacilli bacterium]